MSEFDTTETPETQPTDATTLSDPTLEELNAEAPKDEEVAKDADVTEPEAPAVEDAAPATEEAPEPSEPEVPTELSTEPPVVPESSAEAPAAEPSDEEAPKPEDAAGTEEDPKPIEPVVAAPETPVVADPTKEVSTDEVPSEGDKPAEEDSAEPSAPAAPSDEQGVSKDDQPTQAAPDIGTATAPTKVLDGGDAPDLSTLQTDPGAVTTGNQVKVGDDHVAEGITIAGMGMAWASFYCIGDTFSSWLGAQGLAPWSAPGLVKFASDKHGADARLSAPHWSIVVQEFYAQG